MEIDKNISLLVEKLCKLSLDRGYNMDVNME